MDKHNIKTVDVNALRWQLGVVSQEPNLFNRTIAENIAYGDNRRNVGIDEIIDAAEAANIHLFVASLPLVSKYSCRYIIWKRFLSTSFDN